MLKLYKDWLCFEFPEIHPKARCAIAFNRTLRIPDDNHAYPLPPKLGSFPLRAIDDYSEHVPETWARHGGVFLPLYHSEAMWIELHASTAFPPSPNEAARDWDPGPAYPCAVKVATGKINAITGEPWQNGLSATSQDYVVTPFQRWLDGYNVSKGLVRQFVGTPLGSGHSVEQQLTGLAAHGGVQLAVYPMKPERYAGYCKECEEAADVRFSRRFGKHRHQEVELSAGGLIRQEILRDRFGTDAWEHGCVSRCFVHLLNTQEYQAVTGEHPPHVPFAASDYAKAGLPWFHYATDEDSIEGSATLAGVHSIADMTATQTGEPMHDNASLGPLPVTFLGKKTVRQEPF